MKRVSKIKINTLVPLNSYEVKDLSDSECRKIVGGANYPEPIKPQLPKLP
ncbi:MAG: hypothetical protein RLZZ381_1409 [Cyanobacteriota bacterium]|jgi:hypothetical protein